MIKNYNDFRNEETSKSELTKGQLFWLNQAVVNNKQTPVKSSWKYENGVVNVEGNVKISFRTKKLLVKFGVITGDFNSESSSLETFENFPDEIQGNFICRYCTKITSLKGFPKKVVGNVLLERFSKLKTLDGLSKDIGANLTLKDFSSLESLKGCPSIIKGNFSCMGALSLKNFIGAPKTIEGTLNFGEYEDYERLESMEGFPKTFKDIRWKEDYEKALKKFREQK